MESLLWNPGCGIIAVDSVLWNHCSGIIAVESLALESWLRQHLGGIWEASGRHLGDIWETSGRLGWPGWEVSGGGIMKENHGGDMIDEES